jgi:hypothetical protein
MVGVVVASVTDVDAVVVMVGEAGRTDTVSVESAQEASAGDDTALLLESPP